MLTQLGEWARLGFFTRTGFGTDTTCRRRAPSRQSRPTLNFATQRLGSITTPTLIVGGDRDAFYGSRVFQETAALLPRSRLVLYKGRGHMAPKARPLAREVLMFLEGALDSSPG